ncbi:MAG: glycoside hydrolase family 31 protein [Clostridia bacterium]|nr:glycoside hydrolase family 31 protein [Clostridia bacterium]
MKEFQIDIQGRTLKISAWAENVIRVRVSTDFAKTLQERYSVLTPPEYDGGALEGACLRAGQLKVRATKDGIEFETPECVRELSFNYAVEQPEFDFFMDRTSRFRPERKQIIGDEEEQEQVFANIFRAPKTITLKTKGETFYGLGESNVDRLVLNGKTYLQKVVYQLHELVIPFIMTKTGYAISLNTTFWHAVDVGDRDGNRVTWLLPDGEIDFFIYCGGSLKALLERFTYVTGRSMVLPKWAYGLMFIDQYNADQFEVMRNAATFREKRLPCDSFSLEPGWMAKRHDFSTEKRWNTDRFYICDWMRKTPENFEELVPPKRTFLSALKRYGFKLELWLCCRYDFTANQENRAGNNTDFGIEPWFKHLKTFVCDGARAFKLDPCKLIDTTDETRVYANGRSEAEMHSLQTTLYGKEMYEGMSEYTHLRPMHHLSGGYTSMQKYSACTTGDSGGGIKTLVWILNSGLSGFSNITCDMDIFQPHTIHYCFFTAWCELDSWSGYSHPWWAGDHNEKVFTFYDRYRYHILPYVYSAAISAHLNGTPVVRAMPLEFEDEKLQNTVTQFMFGDNYLVGAFSDTVILPDGEVWIDAWTGKAYGGGKELTVEFPENRGGALFVRNGSIVPTQEDKQFTDCEDDERLTLEVYAVRDTNREYTLYEDGGLDLKYLSGDIANTLMRCVRRNDVVELYVSKRQGSFDGMRDDRKYSVKALLGASPKRVLVDGDEIEFTMEDMWACFDMGTGTLARIEL